MHSPEKWEIKRGVLMVRQPPTTVVLRLQDVHCVHVDPLSPQAAEQMRPGFVVKLVYASNATSVVFDTLAEALTLVDAITAFMVTGTGNWSQEPTGTGGWGAIELDAGVRVESTPTPIETDPDEVETGRVD